MATSKTVNYTPEMTEKLVKGFQAGKTVEELAVEMGRTVRSVIAKLSREKDADGNQIRTAKAYVAKDGKPVESKDNVADAIGKVLNMTEAEIDSLTKANKSALQKVFTALANSVPSES